MTQPSANFDRVARAYQWAEYLSLGPLLERTREHCLPQLTDCRHVLALGDGDGRFLARLLQQNPDAHATAVDTSAAMLGLLQRRCHFADHRLHTQQLSALQIDPPPSTDLVTTHFFLDCLTQADLNALAQRLADSVAPGTLWVVSDFATSVHPLFQPVAVLYIRFLYLAFRVLTGLRTSKLPDPQTALTAAGFQHLYRKEFLGGLLYTELWRRK